MITRTLFFIKCALGLTAMSAVAQTVVPIPNGDFTDPGNTGSIGGGLLAPSVSPRPIGSGPWGGSTGGALGLLASPSVSIGGGALNFSGIAVIDLGALLVTEASAFVSTGTLYEPDTTYSLSFDLAYTGLLDANLLDSAGFSVSLITGAAVNSEGTTVVSSAGDISLLNLTIGGGSGSGTLTYTTPSAGSPSLPTGNIGLRVAFGDSPGLLSVAVVPASSVDNFALTATPVPEPSGVLLTGLAGLGLLARRRRAA